MCVVVIDGGNICVVVINGGWWHLDVRFEDAVEVSRLRALGACSDESGSVLSNVGRHISLCVGLF